MNKEDLFSEYVWLEMPFPTNKPDKIGVYIIVGSDKDWQVYAYFNGIDWLMSGNLIITKEVTSWLKRVPTAALCKEESVSAKNAPTAIEAGIEPAISKEEVLDRTGYYILHGKNVKLWDKPRIFGAMEEYAELKTAAKDKEISKLLIQLNEAYAHHTEDHENAYVSYKALREENDKLKAELEGFTSRSSKGKL